MTVTLTLLSAGYCTCPEHLARGRGPWHHIRFTAMFAMI